MKEQSEEYKKLIKIFKRIQFNAVFFLENYYNVAHPNEQIILTDDEKQELFNQFRGIPFVGGLDDIGAYMQRIDKLKEEGKRDWEIF